MSLTPEQRDELAGTLQAALYAINCHNGHLFKSGTTTDGGIDPRWCDECGEARHRAAADALAPVIARWLAAEREAGAAEVRARVEAVLTDPEFHIETALGGSDYVREAIRAALSTEEPS